MTPAKAQLVLVGMRATMTDPGASKAGAAARAMILPLALAQFIASYAATNMNVAISPIAKDLGTTVAGCRRRSRCSLSRWRR